MPSSSARRGRASPGRSARGRHAPRAERLRILFLASQFPYPADSGGTIKTLSILDYLQRRHDVRLVCFRRKELSPGQAEWARKFGEVISVQLAKGRSPWNLVRSYVSGVPLSIERNRSTQMAKVVADSVSGWSPQAVFVDSWLMAQYLPESYGGLKLLHEHNAEFELWDRQAELESGPRKSLATREAQRVRQYESDLLRRFDTVFAVSEDDRRSLRDLGAEPNRVRILPNIPDRALLDLASPSFERSEPVVLYIGTLSWQPNIEGVERLVGAVFPAVHKRAPESRLVVAGHGSPRALADRVTKTAGAEFLGEVEDIESLYQNARVFVDATRSGGGTRLKILNALARGVPVVASQHAAQGLDIVPGEHLVVARNDHAMADAVVDLLQNRIRWKVLSENGRALIRGRYVAEVAFRPLDEALARTQTGAPPDAGKR